ncbi:MAG TPA: glycoside hydrolase family 16 protein, partial [Bacteroidales bacterium]|nr:glycoside hydrolase family 16 protein [Bacteroidales bacterium]
MASLRFMLGMIPSTARIEQEEKALITEFAKLRSFAESEQLANYIRLDKLVNSGDFIQKKKDMESLQYKTSTEYSREKEFLSLQKSKDIIMYFRTAADPYLRKFRELDNSEKIERYEALSKEVTSLEFRQKIKAKNFRETDDSKKLQEYKNLKSSEEIREYYKFKGSKAYANFLNIDGSSRLARYNELKDYVASPEFIKQKEYLLDKKRFEKTEMFREITEYNKLKKDPDIIWYFKVKDSAKFDLLKQRELTFSDEFDGEKLDTKKWLTNYYWGDKLLHDRYSVESDLQAFTGDNFELRNSLLKINIKPQKVTGKVWSANKGFSTKQFDYTSGIINSGTSFRQKYGIFSAKIKLGDPNARNAFWMLSDKITPHVDICKTSRGKVWFDYFNGNGSQVKTSVGSKYSNDFFIYTLEWTPDKLVWKINNTEVFTQTSNVPQEPMYINLAGTLEKPLNSMTSMEIDWVRVYKPKN